MFLLSHLQLGDGGYGIDGAWGSGSVEVEVGGTWGEVAQVSARRIRPEKPLTISEAWRSATLTSLPDRFRVTVTPMRAGDAEPHPEQVPFRTEVDSWARGVAKGQVRMLDHVAVLREIRLLTSGKAAALWVEGTLDGAAQGLIVGASWSATQIFHVVSRTELPDHEARMARIGKALASMDAVVDCVTCLRG